MLTNLRNLCVSLNGVNNTEMNGRVLKECPFCGGYARFCEDIRFREKSNEFPKWYVICDGCNIRTAIANRTTVMKMWNRRVNDERSE